MTLNTKNGCARGFWIEDFDTQSNFFEENIYSKSIKNGNEAVVIKKNQLCDITGTNNSENLKKGQHRVTE